MFIISNKIVLFNCFIIYLYSLSYYAAADWAVAFKSQVMVTFFGVVSDYVFTSFTVMVSAADVSPFAIVVLVNAPPRVIWT